MLGMFAKINFEIILPQKLLISTLIRKGKYGAQIAETLVVTLGYGLILLLLHIIAIIIQKCQKTKDRMPNYSKV